MGGLILILVLESGRSKWKIEMEDRNGRSKRKLLYYVIVLRYYKIVLVDSSRQITPPESLIHSRTLVYDLNLIRLHVIMKSHHERVSFFQSGFLDHTHFFPFHVQVHFHLRFLQVSDGTSQEHSLARFKSSGKLPVSGYKPRKSRGCHMGSPPG